MKFLFVGPPSIYHYINITPDILEMNKTVLVVEDVMFTNGVGFLVQISHNIRFATIQYVVQRTTGIIFTSFNWINEVYAKCGIYVETFYMNR